MNNSKLDIKIHPKEDLKMTITSSPWLRLCAGLSMLLCAASVTVLAAVPMVKVVIGLFH